eukprot:gene6809-4889_t
MYDDRGGEKWVEKNNEKQRKTNNENNNNNDNNNNNKNKRVPETDMNLKTVTEEKEKGKGKGYREMTAALPTHAISIFLYATYKTKKKKKQTSKQKEMSNLQLHRDMFASSLSLPPSDSFTRANDLRGEFSILSFFFDFPFPPPFIFVLYASIHTRVGGERREWKFTETPEEQYGKESRSEIQDIKNYG